MLPWMSFLFYFRWWSILHLSSVFFRKTFKRGQGTWRTYNFLKQLFFSKVNEKYQNMSRHFPLSLLYFFILHNWDCSKRLCRSITMMCLILLVWRFPALTSIFTEIKEQAKWRKTIKRWRSVPICKITKWSFENCK